MPSADLPEDIPSPLTSSHSSVATQGSLSSQGSNSDACSSLVKSSEKYTSYGAFQSSLPLKEECDTLPFPITFQAKNRFAALSAADVLIYQYDPFWARLRTGMLAFFWLLLLALIVAVGTTAALDTRACSFSPPD